VQSRAWASAGCGAVSRQVTPTKYTQPLTPASTCPHHEFVRELVYLSERKLRQFMIGKPRRWGSRPSIEGEVKFPGVGGVKVGSAAPAGGDEVIPDLVRVISALETSDRAAGWFADDAVQPGQWVYFEAPLCYAPLSDGTLPEAVVFLDHGEPTASYPTGGAIRLLMHGSAEHLLGAAVTSPASEDDDRTDGSRNPSRYTDLRMFARLLYRLNRHSPSSDAEPDLDRMTAPYSTRYRLEMQVPRVVELLDDLLEPQLTAAWMAGHARVTAILPLPSGHDPDPVAVIATPLYVEYVSPPSNE
jgi:hypothetical protein